MDKVKAAIEHIEHATKIDEDYADLFGEEAQTILIALRALDALLEERQVHIECPCPKCGHELKFYGNSKALEIAREAG